jgi:hypothetical protein
MLRLVKLLASLLLLSPAGCGEDSAFSAEDFIAQYSAAYCSYLIYCCDSAERSYGSQAACQQAVDAEVAQLLAFRDAPQPFASFMGTEAKACVDALKTRRCTEDPTLVEGCLGRITRAAHTTGEECTYSAECESYYCVQTQQNVKGSCGIASNECNVLDLACGADQYCQANTCQPKLEAATPCARGGQCLSGICSPTAKVCANRTEPFCDGL